MQHKNYRRIQGSRACCYSIQQAQRKHTASHLHPSLKRNAPSSAFATVRLVVDLCPSLVYSLSLHPGDQSYRIKRDTETEPGPPNQYVTHPLLPKPQKAHPNSFSFACSAAPHGYQSNRGCCYIRTLPWFTPTHDHVYTQTWSSRGAANQSRVERLWPNVFHTRHPENSWVRFCCCLL